MPQIYTKKPENVIQLPASCDMSACNHPVSLRDPADLTPVQLSAEMHPPGAMLPIFTTSYSCNIVLPHHYPQSKRLKLWEGSCITDKHNSIKTDQMLKPETACM